MSTAIVSGALANKPFNGGNAWTRLSWVLGLRRLGLNVLFVEEIDESNCVDDIGAPTTFENSANLAYFRSTMAQFGLASASALICDGGKRIHGLALSELIREACQARLLFNLSGHLKLPELKNAAACKVYYDDDPGFTQFWRVAGHAEARLDGHDFYFTIGANIGAPDCVIPTGEITWRHTRPPVMLSEWPVCGTKSFDRFTTVASWRGAYGPVQFGGKTYGLKVHEFRKFLDLPSRSGLRFEIALQIHPGDQKDMDALRYHGWQIVDPKNVAGSPDAYRRYLQASSAEFSVAQAIYVDTNSGWFSDRTARYLASGRPALVQDTGFSRHIPVGEGLLTFHTLEEGIEGAARIERDYEKHCRAARRLAEECFDSGKIIGRLLEEVGLTP
jgi:hypothetical protein